jgi:hypothetical protein
MEGRNISTEFDSRFWLKQVLEVAIIIIIIIIYNKSHLFSA